MQIFLERKQTVSFHSEKGSEGFIKLLIYLSFLFAKGPKEVLLEFPHFLKINLLKKK